MKRQAAPARGGRERFKFISNVISELRKVTWPTRREAIYLGTIVIIISIVVGIVLGALDYGFSKFVEVLLGG